MSQYEFLESEARFSVRAARSVGDELLIGTIVDGSVRYRLHSSVIYDISHYAPISYTDLKTPHAADHLGLTEYSELCVTRKCISRIIA